MSLPEINCCPSSLSAGFNTYSRAALIRLFYGKKVSHVLPFDSPQLDEETAEKFRQNRKIMSISGVQIKQSFRLEKNMLRLVEEGEQGQYILKPIPHRETIGEVEELPANEHLTMQIAKQVYKLKTAESGIIFFRNGEPAYITKRFDYDEERKKISQEDFATLLMRTKATHGETFKNEGSYQDLAVVMQKIMPAYQVEVEKYYSLVLFNYLFSNGDAHLKNFSVQRTSQGDHILSAAYDLLNTRIHIRNDTAMALTNGLFADNFTTESFQANGFYAYDDFYNFGLKVKIKEARVVAILEGFKTESPQVLELINNSFLKPATKERYLEYYRDRLRALNYSLSIGPD